MAAPESTVWGAIEGGYGRIGIYVNRTITTTAVSATVEIWFWSKYSVSDSSNNLYFDNKATNVEPSIAAMTKFGTVSVSTTVSSGSGWSTSNQVKLKSFTYTYNKSGSTQTRYLYAKFADIDRVGATMAASTTIAIPALAKYTISYNANGGTGAPSSQTKTYNSTLTLSSAKPTRTGYDFKGWATSASGSVAYAAGASYTANASVTLYAVWQAKTYAVRYDANGGSGAPSQQTKTYGVNLKLSSTIPTRSKHTFKGWGTSASATTVAYAAGATYTGNAPLTLYAIWEINYVNPIIHSLQVSRCDSTGALTDEGTCGLISFQWQTSYAVSAISISWIPTDGTGSATVTASGTSGKVNKIVGFVAYHKVELDSGRYTTTNEAVEISSGSIVEGAETTTGEKVYFGTLADGTELYYTEVGLKPDTTYKITVIVEDSGGNSTATSTLASAVFPIDVLYEGRGIAFGKTAELESTADFGYQAKFNEAVYGKALGLDWLPGIPENSDLNDYKETGCYAVHGNAIAETCANMPIKRAGRLEVWAATGEGIRLTQWSYLRQRFIPYNSENAVWERDITRSADNVWRYYDWWKSNLTPAASEKVYSKAAITIALGANTTLGALNTYTKIPLDKLSISTSDRLTMQSNSIRIGANISHVKVSGQFLIKCGSITGNRHARLQKESGGTTTSLAWVVLTGTASSNTVFHFTPFIVPVKEGDLLKVVYYTGDVDDMNVSGSAANGWQTYLTAEEL